MIIVIGAPDEYHAAHIHQKITDRGGDAVYFDTRKFPTFSRLAIEPANQERGTGYFQPEPGGQKIPFSMVQSVYWRYYMGLAVDPAIEEAYLKEMASREIQSAIGVFFRNLQCPFINSPEAIDQHRYKGYQLNLMHQAGIRVPETLMTNDPDAVVDFFHRHKGQVIFKPISGGAHTTKLTQEDLTPERLGILSRAPVQFQEFVPGVDIRVYLVDGQIYPAEIRSKTLDFREDLDAVLVPITLPDAVVTDCYTVAKTLGLVFTGIDVRRTAEDEYVFLEGNPSPMFAHFENKTGYPISDGLVKMLMEPDRVG